MLLILIIIVNLMQEQQSLEPITKIKQDLSSSPLLRYYLQEDAFTLAGQGSKVIQLPFNQLAYEVVTDTTLGNSFLAINTRLNTNFLDNGKDIFQKKRVFFQNFLAEYPLINKGLVYLSQNVRQVFVYTVMAVSNLILKLSINMAKISIVVTSRLLTPSYLNVYTVSLLFEKYIQLNLLQNQKNNKSIQEMSGFIKQFPKVSLIKLTKRRNPYDFLYISKCQNLFSKDAQNVQLIELFETEEEIEGNSSQNNLKRGEKFNLKQLFGIKAPYGMELYLFFNEVLIEKIAQYKPDIVIFFETVPCDKLSIEPRVKGLIINEISARVQNKIYIFKEFGPTDQMKNQLFTENNRSPLLQMPLLLKSKLQANCKNPYEIFLNTFESQTLKQESNEIIKAFIQESCKAQERIIEQVQKSRLEEFSMKRKQIQHKPEQTQRSKAIKRMRKILYDDISTMSLSLIQKSNFQEAVLEFRNKIFPVFFLTKLIDWMSFEKQRIDQQKFFSDASERLNNKINRLKSMRQLSIYRASPSHELNSLEWFTFYNLISKKQQVPLELVNGKERSLSINKKDTFYLHYNGNNLLLFHLAFESTFKVYYRWQSQKFFRCVREELYRDKTFLSSKFSALVANSMYFYKAFGELEGDVYKSTIYRLNISDVFKIGQQEWEAIDSCIMVSGEKELNVDFEQKKWGWAESIDLGNGDNLTIFGGGYNFNAINEERISKFLLIIKNHSSKVYKIGKTSREVLNEAQNYRLRNVAYPFVYGVPLYHTRSELVLLNTNGYIEHVNNFKRFYLTKYHLDAKVTSIGIVSQNKMSYGVCSETSIANKNTFLSIISKNYTQINRINGQCCFTNVDGLPTVLTVKTNQKGADQQGKEGVCDKVIAEILGTENMLQGNQIIQMQFDNQSFALKGDLNSIHGQVKSMQGNGKQKGGKV